MVWRWRCLLATAAAAPLWWRCATGLQIQVTSLVDTAHKGRSDYGVAPPQASTCLREAEPERVQHEPLLVQVLASVLFAGSALCRQLESIMQCLAD